MKVTQTTSNAVATTPGGPDLDGSPQSRPTKSKAVFGGVISTTPAVAAHVRRKVADTGQRLNSPQFASVATPGKPDLDGSSQSQPPGRKAVFGGVISAAPAVAAHVRKQMAHTGQRLNSLQVASVATLGEPDLDGSSQSQPPSRKAVFGGVISTTRAVAAHVRRKMAHTGQGSPLMNQPKKA